MPRALAVIPHPDDESYSFGGTLALLAAAGWDVVVCCASSGEKGKRHDGGPTDPVSVGMAREAELRASCEVLGAQEPLFLRLPDGELRNSQEGPALVEGVLGRVAPELVLTLGADGAYGHPDHIAVHRWVVEAWEAAQDLPAKDRPSSPAPLPTPAWRESGGAGPALVLAAFPKGLFVPQWLKCIRMMGEPPRPAQHQIGNAVWHYDVAIQAVSARKRSAVEAHASQLPGGQPESLFPEGIVSALLDTEHFEDATGRTQAWVAELLHSLAG